MKVPHHIDIVDDVLVCVRLNCSSDDALDHRRKQITDILKHSQLSERRRDKNGAVANFRKLCILSRRNSCDRTIYRRASVAIMTFLFERITQWSLSRTFQMRSDKNEDFHYIEHLFLF